MDHESRIAFIHSQVAMMNCEMEAMKAENQYRIGNGHTIAYGEDQWHSFKESWESILGHNAVIEYLR